MSVFRKVADTAALSAFAMSAVTASSGFFTYLWVTDEDNQQKILDTVVDHVAGKIVPGAPSADDIGIDIPKLPF